MFDEFERVRIKASGVVGTIVDKSVRGGKVWYVVESDVRGRVDGADGGEYPLYDCNEEDLAAVEEVVDVEEQVRAVV